MTNTTILATEQNDSVKRSVHMKNQNMKLSITLSLIAIATSVVMHFTSTNQRKVDFFQQSNRLIQLAEEIQHQKLYLELAQAIVDENIQDLKIQHFYKASGGGSLGPERTSQRALLFFENSRPISEEEYNKLTTHISGPVISDGGNLRGSTGYWESSLKVIPQDRSSDHMKTTFQVEYSFSCTYL